MFISLGLISSLLVLAASRLSIVSASLYATQPIADTVYTTGRDVSVNWVDDGFKPHISSMGDLTIDLYEYDDWRDKYVMTLAEGVSPTSMSYKVHLPASLGNNDSEYTLRFICKNPPLIIYTADFTIASSNRPLTKSVTTAHPTGSRSRGHPPTSTTTELSPAPLTTDNMQPFFLTLVLSNSTVVSELPPRTTPTPVTTFYAGQDQKQDDQPQAPGFDESTGKYASSGRARMVDIEKLKFRIVFILWPALMGITMAI